MRASLAVTPARAITLGLRPDPLRAAADWNADAAAAERDGGRQIRLRRQARDLRRAAEAVEAERARFRLALFGGLV